METSGLLYEIGITLIKGIGDINGKKLVAYCGGPGCKAWWKGADQLEAKGYKNIKHYSGGIKEWKSAGLEVGKKEMDKKEG